MILTLTKMEMNSNNDHNKSTRIANLINSNYLSALSKHITYMRILFNKFSPIHPRGEHWVRLSTKESDQTGQFNVEPVHFPVLVT